MSTRRVVACPSEQAAADQLAILKAQQFDSTRVEGPFDFIFWDPLPVGGGRQIDAVKGCWLVIGDKD